MQEKWLNAKAPNVDPQGHVQSEEPNADPNSRVQLKVQTQA